MELMQDIGFGWIDDLHVENGQPVLDDQLQIVKVTKFGGENGPRSELSLEDFALRAEVVEFFDHLRQIKSGCVDRIVIKHGIPFTLQEEIQL